MSKLPNIAHKHKVCIICEGYEDYEYIKRLVSFNVWNQIYEFCLINAKSASNIAGRYQDAYSNDRYEAVLIFCDTDKAPYREYAQIKTKINKFHDYRNAANKVIIFANPCTMQIILMHFGEIILKNQGKKTNGTIIYDLTGIENYDAHEEQIKELCSKIFKRTYPDMKKRVAEINCADTVSGSTNFINYIENFEADNLKWIDNINKALLSKEQ